MAVRLISFKVNETSSSFQNTSELYYNVLNGGETVENTLQYDFSISVDEHTIESFTIESLIFNSNEQLLDTKPLIIEVYKDSNKLGQYSGNVISSSNSKTPFQIKFNNSGQDSGNITLSVIITNPGSDSIYYGLSGFTYTLSDVLKDVKVSFSGPLTGRNSNTITCSTIELSKGTQAISFTKDPTSNFSGTNDNVDGRIYFKQNGIFVDGFQYGVNAEATTETKGIVKLSQSSFEIDDDGGVIPPNEVGIAATPQLVFNALATAKGYVDEVIAPIELNVGNLQSHVDGIQAILDGVDAPLIMNIELNDDSIIGLGDTLTFSKDFKKEDNKLYINWLELI